MEKPTCENCRYFVNYLYIKDTHLFAANMGLCAAKKYKKQGNYCRPNTLGCVRWKEKQKLDKQSIKTVLNTINNRLEELVLLLEYNKKPRGD